MKKSKPKSFVPVTLKTLSPTAFENLTFDLVSSIGLRNAVWRTPGSDGGRDIEGEAFEVDFSGAHSSKRWYVECKRYSGSVDWPTVHGKVAYAASRAADFLLMVTSSSFTPTCIDAVNSWNSQNRFPKIRLWNGFDLDLKLASYPPLLIKYGLSADPGLEMKGFFDLAVWVAKASLSAYSRGGDGGALSKELTLSATLSELLMSKMQQFRVGKVFPIAPFVPATDGLSTMTFAASKYDIDRYAFRALLSLSLLYTDDASLNVAAMSDNTLLIPLPNIGRITESETALFSIISFWGDVEVTLDDAKISIKSRIK